MARQFFHTTAELTIRVVEAVLIIRSADINDIERFCDVPNGQATEALGLAADLGLISLNGGKYGVASPLARFTSSPKENRKAAILRIAIENYEPFIVFRERLLATGSADTAATQTIALLGLNRHREDTKDTLLSLSTYSGAIATKGGGKYARGTSTVDSQLQELSKACADGSAAREWVYKTFEDFSNKVSRDEVLLPLASALEKALGGNPQDAITEAGTAFESFLVELAGRMRVNIEKAHGIISKLDRFQTNKHLPSKIVNSAKYIGHVRNAAGHGIDTDIATSWEIQESTGLDYVRVVCSMIRACCTHEAGTGHIL